MKVSDIPQAHGFDAAVEHVHAVYSGEIPAFQFSAEQLEGVRENPYRDLLALFAAIEEGSELVTGTAIPISNGSPALATMTSKYLSIHTDRRSVGVSVHHNHSGEGAAQFAYFSDDYDAPNDGRGDNFVPDRGKPEQPFTRMQDTMQGQVDEVYEGAVKPGTITVFSQGGILLPDGSMTRNALHNFQQNPQERRRYERYSTSEKYYHGLEHDDLVDVATWLKGKLLAWGGGFGDTRYLMTHSWDDGQASQEQQLFKFYTGLTPISRENAHLNEDDYTELIQPGIYPPHLTNVMIEHLGDFMGWDLAEAA